MKRIGLATILLALMVVLADYTDGAGTVTKTQTDGTADAMTTALPDGDDVVQTGTMNLYVSGEQNAIADLEHLNVTIERVTLVRTSGNAKSETEADTDDAEASDEIRAETRSETDTTNDTDTEANASVEAEIEANATVNTMNTSASINGPAGVNADADAGAGADMDIESADVDDTGAIEGGSRVAYGVDNTTIDLTELQGENASLAGEYDMLGGNYTRIFMHVSEVNGTLKTGERVNVKLPSDRLQPDTDFEIGNDESVDFVSDITVFETGNSGEYIPKSVVSESGANVPTIRVGAGETIDAEAAAETETGANAEAEAAENETDDNGECIESDAEGDLSVSLDGSVSTGESATAVVTRDGTPVENATVMINDEAASTTDANNELGVTIPDRRGVTIVAVDGESKAETEFEFEVVRSAPDNPDEGGESTTLTA